MLLSIVYNTAVHLLYFENNNVNPLMHALKLAIGF